MKRLLLGFWLLLLLTPFICYAFQPLPVEQAFSLSVRPVDNHTLIAQWTIAPGYHLYRDRFSFNIVAPDTVHLGAITFPPGISKEDDILGKYQIYENSVTITLPLLNANPIARQLILAIGYQGCADSGFCYPPVNKQITLNLASVTSHVSSLSTSVAPAAQDEISRLLATQHWFFILMGFLGFGLLLAFTPCVLPMIPILSGIIVGQGETITTLRAFWLSFIYVLAMAITYALAGVLAGLAGNYVQAFLQNSWVVGIFSAVFVLLALSLFGFYELRLPNSWHHHVAKLSNRQSGGSYVGVAIMGCLSTLIVSPCVTAPLIGALSYIGKTGDAVLGGSALFAMGLGMGIPLLIIGTAGGKLLPKAGVWMDTVKAFFGVLMLAVAILLLGRIISPQFTMVLWAALLIVSAVYMGVFTTTPLSGFGKLWKGSSLILLVYGFLLLIGAGMGNTDPLQPLAIKQAIPVASMPQAGPFKPIKSLEDLQQAITEANAQGKPVMLDFYADWCVSCKEMDRNTFNNPHVQALLSHFVLLRADVTANDAVDEALEKKLDVIAPPTILFFNTKGEELTSERVVGEMEPKEFLQHLQQVLSKEKN